MALIQCPECKREISDKASFCPGCGCPISSSYDDNYGSYDDAYDNEYYDKYEREHEFYEELPEGLRTECTFLSSLAQALSLFPLIGYIGLLLAIIEIKLDEYQQYNHKKSEFAIAVSIVWTIVLVIILFKRIF